MPGAHPEGISSTIPTLGGEGGLVVSYGPPDPTEELRDVHKVPCETPERATVAQEATPGSASSGAQAPGATTYSKEDMRCI